VLVDVSTAVVVEATIGAASGTVVDRLVVDDPFTVVTVLVVRVTESDTFCKSYSMTVVVARVVEVNDPVPVRVVPEALVVVEVALMTLVVMRLMLPESVVVMLVEVMAVIVALANDVRVEVVVVAVAASMLVLVV